MRVLLDTNILIHREAHTVVREDIGTLFRWLDDLGHNKCVHPESVAEIKKHADARVRKTLGIKLGSYSVLKTLAADTPAVTGLRASDKSPNDTVDSSLLAEVAAGRVGALITEDRGIHRKAAAIGVGDLVFTIESFLEKVTAENPALAEYKVLAVKKARFGELDVKDSFFDSFRIDYPGFDEWFNRKADEEAYVTKDAAGNVVAFLYLKREGPNENYSDIVPAFGPARRLKIGTFKVIANGLKLGERFLKIIFDNAVANRVDDVYVTLFRRTSDHDRLARVLADWGFIEHGHKLAADDRSELVMVRDFSQRVHPSDPRSSFPFVSGTARKFIVPIYPQYHQELLPDSLLRTENPEDVADSKSHRNALSKVYISRSIERGMRPGDIVVFYRTQSGGPAHYTSVVTTLGVIQETILDIASPDEFISACRKRSVFSDEKLLEHWNYNKRYRPFVVNFLYVQSFPKRPNLARMRELGILTNAPRGFEQLSDEAFARIVSEAEIDDYIIVDQA